MVVGSATEAVHNALRYTHNTKGMCLAYVRTWLGIDSRYRTAYSAWLNSGAKHSNDHHPPAGAPVFWRGGSHGYGHIALSLGNGKIRTTDVPGTGQTSTVDLDWIALNWHMAYLGWTETLNGVLVPYLQETQVSSWATGDVWVSMLHEGNRDSDSVARLTYRMRHAKRLPDAHKPRVQNNDYNKGLVEAVRYWQTKLRPGIEGPDDGTHLSNAQAEKMFGKRYKVHPK